jgi:hypothetical protein
MKTGTLCLVVILFNVGLTKAQVSINSDGSAVHPSAMLDVNSSERGFLLPRLTRVQRDSIIMPAAGLMVFCTNCGTSGALSMYINGSWTTFLPCLTQQPGEGVHVILPGQITWNWLPAPGAAGYRWNTVADLESSENLGNSLMKTETGILCDSIYTRYLWSYSICGESPMQVLSAVSPFAAPASPVEGTHVPAQTAITWVWNPVAGASGYKWSRVNDYDSAVDVLSMTSYTDTGYLCETGYVSYVWAYNRCGHSLVDSLSGSTLACWNCGISTLTVNHDVVNSVAPVNKIVTYGTVTNIPGESSKCWITRNLGAGQVATTVHDASEAAAGWYWQFNRKQGYKHDGTLVTPAWDGSFIAENSGWLVENDPCGIELGQEWRIPTYTEWENVKTAGGWTNIWGAWNSDLKIHNAGYIHYSGYLSERGIVDNYFSTTQYDNETSYSYYANNYVSNVTYGFKNHALPVRCLK